MSDFKEKNSLSHVAPDGTATMVDVSAKGETTRIARASGKVTMSAETVRILREHGTPKGDPLETARLAGIMAAKQTPQLIPLCHPLLLEHVDVTATLVDDGVVLGSSVTMTGKTGAEMEALTAVTVAALTVYDMVKAVDKGMVIEAVRLESKSGGKSADWSRGKK